MLWINFAVGALFIILGLAVHKRKAYFLIAGYNTMREEDKANVDVAGLARLMGIYFYVNGSIFILMGIMYAAGLRPSTIPALIFLLISTTFVVIKSQKHNRNLFDENGRMRRGSEKKVILPLALLAVAMLFVGLVLLFSAQATEVSFKEEGLEIHGLYGSLYVWEDMYNVRIMEELPRIELRTNGTALGSQMKGNFRTSELETVTLYVDAERPPFIYFEADGQTVILNLKNAEETKAAYEEIRSRL